LKRKALGKVYRDGECIVYEGDPSECLFVVQDGHVEIAYDEEDRTTRLILLGKGDLFGESALFGRQARSANVQVLLRRIKEDPVLALELLRSMSRRARALEDLVKRARSERGVSEAGAADGTRP